MRTITQTLNMTPGGVPPVIHVSQYDSDFTITFTLFSLFGGFTIESGTTAQIRGTKSSGTGYSADAAINISAKTVTVTGNAQMTAAAGQNIFEIVLKKNNKEISSKNFILHVERAALDADTITDESVLRELNAIIEGAETATQAAEEAGDAADRAEAAAQSLVIDPTPTQGSAHAVSSGGVYESVAELGEKIDEVTEDIGISYEQIEFEFGTTTSTAHDVTFEQSSNGTIHVYGTNTHTARTLNTVRNASGTKLEFSLTAGETYRLTGCPIGGGGDTYELDIRKSSGGGGLYHDYGSGGIFTVAETDTYIMNMAIGVGQTVDITFTPKLEKQVRTEPSELSAIDKVVRSKLADINVNARLNETTDDLDIIDEDGYVLVSFADGHIKTKNFDSSDIEAETNIDAEESPIGDDLNIVDDDYYSIVTFANGHIKTRNFDSREVRTIASTRYYGAKISVLGDSISSFNGFSPSSWNPYYPTYGPDVDSVSKMWFSIVADAIGGSVLASASWGASGVCGNSEDSTGNVGSSSARIAALAPNSVNPDIIFIEMGTNDWSSNRTIGGFDESSELPANGTITDFSQAYAKMLSRIMSTYPLATVFCMTISARLTNADSTFPVKNSNGITIPAFNAEIRKIANIFGAKVININSCGITVYNLSTYAGEHQLHPNAAGHVLMAKEVISELLK